MRSDEVHRHARVARCTVGVAGPTEAEERVVLRHHLGAGREKFGAEVGIRPRGS